MTGLVVAATAAVILGGCAGDDDSEAAPSSTTSPPATSSAAPTTTPPVTTLPPATTSTTAPTTTTGVPPSTIVPVPGTLALTRVEFGTDPYAVLTNVGNEPVGLAGRWLVSGTMNTELTPPPGTGAIQPGRTAVIVLGGDPPPQFVGVQAVVDLGTSLGTIDSSGGELLLVSDIAPIERDSVIDYVAWGAGPHLNETTASAARIWSTGAAVELAPEAISISSPGTLGAGVEDWKADIGG
jgi:hypothetical protein